LNRPNALFENFPIHRERYPFIRRTWIDAHGTELIDHLRFFLGQSLALEEVLLPGGDYDFHPELVRPIQILVQMPPVRAVPQKDQASFAHQRKTVVSASGINLEFCDNGYRAVFGRWQPLWSKVLREDRKRRRLKSDALGKVD
jgi:hypothetical protein